MSVPELVVATACPASIPDWQWPRLAALLDDDELSRSRCFAFDADRRAYVLAHALRHCLLGGAVGEGWHASLSRRRSIVACAVTRAAPVGVDVEPPENEQPADLLRPFLATPTDDFLSAWTALEAFWKAMGTGLDERQPRIALRARRGTWGSVRMEGEEDGPPAGHVLVRDAAHGARLSVALRAPLAALPEISVIHGIDALDMARPGHAAAPPRRAARPSMAASPVVGRVRQ